MNKLLLTLAAVFLSLGTAGTAAAIPKAAENASAPVGSGADAPKPKKNTARHANPPEKKSVKKKKKAKTARH